MNLKNEKKNLAIIIVNWNKRDLLKTCLESLRAQTWQNFRTIVVDNGSTDGSADFLRENYPEVEIIELEENTGFAHGNNVGIGKAFEDGDIKYIITLNNDTKLAPDYVEKMLDCAKDHPEAASIQPKVLSFFKKKEIDNVGIFPTYFGITFNRGERMIDEKKFSYFEEIFGSNATAALYSKEALEKTEISPGEYFDNSYFAYCEDADLAWRMRLAGFKSYYCPEALIFHVHSATGKNISRKRFLIYRNSFVTLFKNYPSVLLVLALSLLPLHLCVVVFKKRKMGDIIHIANSLGYVFENRSSIFKKRLLIGKNRKIRWTELIRWLKFFK